MNLEKYNQEASVLVKHELLFADEINKMLIKKNKKKCKRIDQNGQGQGLVLIKKVSGLIG